MELRSPGIIPSSPLYRPSLPFSFPLFLFLSYSTPSSILLHFNHSLPPHTHTLTHSHLCSLFHFSYLFNDSLSTPSTTSTSLHTFPFPLPTSTTQSYSYSPIPTSTIILLSLLTLLTSPSLQLLPLFPHYHFPFLPPPSPLLSLRALIPTTVITPHYLPRLPHSPDAAGCQSSRVRSGTDVMDGWMEGGE